MPCTLCPHPKCKHSMIRQGVSSCPECDNGTLVLDPVSAPKWRVDCNRCSFLIYLPTQLHTVKLAKEHCQVGCPVVFVYLWFACRQPVTEKLAVSLYVPSDSCVRNLESVRINMLCCFVLLTMQDSYLGNGQPITLNVAKCGNISSFHCLWHIHCTLMCVS